jgi:hypothetical protein
MNIAVLPEEAMPAVRIVCAVWFTGCAALCGGSGGSDPDPSVPHSLPPVLRNQEPEANVIVRLPGPAPVAVASTVKTAGRVEPNVSGPAPDDPPRPLLRHIYPSSFEQDSALFCQGLIGQWTASDARFLLGESIHQRPALDDYGAQNGTIFAFSDPTNRYKELELDFNGTDGTLRTVFVYPFHLTWQEARQKWGNQVNATVADNGRRFYSYVDRHLDVLVDRTGKVISFGLY